MDELEYADFIVICHTNDCLNAEIPIQAPSIKDGPQFICGVCGQSITDVILAK